MKRAQVYKSNNCYFDPKEMVATSYNWWHFIRRVGGLVVYNNHNYSNTTRTHQGNVLHVMSQLGINVDLTVDTGASLRDPEAVKFGIKNLCFEIAELMVMQKYGRLSRASEIASCEEKIESLLTLQTLDLKYYRVSKKDIKQFIKDSLVQAESYRIAKLERKKRDRESSEGYIQKQNAKYLVKKLNEEEVQNAA